MIFLIVSSVAAQFKEYGTYKLANHCPLIDHCCLTPNTNQALELGYSLKIGDCSKIQAQWELWPAEQKGKYMFFTRGIIRPLWLSAVGTPEQNGQVGVQPTSNLLIDNMEFQIKVQNFSPELTGYPLKVDNTDLFLAANSQKAYLTKQDGRESRWTLIAV